jgi:hydroxypyruvate reductase
MGGQRKLRRDGEAIFGASLAAVEPERLVRRALKRRGSELRVGERRFDLTQVDRILVIGAGKGSAAMARGVEKTLAGRIDDGVVVVKYGHSVPLEIIRIIEAGHPVPDENSLLGARAILDCVREAGKGDLVLCLLSGGGSALIDEFEAGIPLADASRATQLLLACGATIAEVNTLRKHISKLKGGGLAARVRPAPLLTLILSDVIGDFLDVIASGPTVPDPTTFADALHILTRYGLTGKFPRRIVAHLKEGAAGRAAETPKGRSPVFRSVVNEIIGSNRMAVDAAAAQARRLGYRPMVLTTRLSGDARAAAGCLISIAREVQAFDRPVRKPACLIAGGETTVTLRGRGKGGRNQEMALAAAVALEGTRGIVFLSGGTDGTDGPTDAAGGIVDSTTLLRGRREGLDPITSLDNNDAYPFLQQVGGHLVTGPTLTNVMDIICVLVV